MRVNFITLFGLQNNALFAPPFSAVPIKMSPPPGDGALPRRRGGLDRASPDSGGQRPDGQSGGLPHGHLPHDPPGEHGGALGNSQQHRCPPLQVSALGAQHCYFS